jgi:hypothetical protein
MDEEFERSFSDTSRELFLYISQSGQFVPQRDQIIKNIAKHKKKGEYDETKGVQAFWHLAMTGAISYTIENGAPADKYYNIFSVEDRRQCARQLLVYYEEEIEEALEK